ncbi:MAG TPA: hypothetical protein VKY74_04955 [Chloroflexia bacterium]|nr:hypothetical protein [Chloroflexia bacterium]
MARQFPPGSDDPAELRPPAISRRGLALAAGLATVIALALVPLLVPAVGGSLTGSAPQAYWYISRACAFVALGLLWLSMLAGLGIPRPGARGDRWITRR